MTRNVWLWCVLFLFAVYLTPETSGYVQFDGDLSKSNSSDDDPLKSSSPRNEGCESTNDGCKSEANSEKPKITHVPLGPRRTRSIDSSVNTMNENEGNARESQPVKNAVTSTANPTASDVPGAQPKNTKRGHKKLKLAQSKPGYKKSKNKGRSSDKDHEEESLAKKSKRHIGSFFSEEQAAGNSNQIDSRQANKWNRLMFKIQRDKEDDYYARRKAVMERFYNRSHEIERKYKEQASATTETISRYDLGLPTLGSTVSSPTTESARLNTPRRLNKKERTRRKNVNDDIDSHEYYEEYDYYIEEESNTTPATTTTTTTTSTTPEATTTTTTTTSTTSTTTKSPPLVNGNKVYEWGQCTGKTHTAFYQQNVSLNVFRGAEMETDLRASIGPEYCVTCIRVELLNKSKSQVTLSVLEAHHVKLKIRDSENEQLTFVARFFATRETNGRC